MRTLQEAFIATTRIDNQAKIVYKANKQTAYIVKLNK